jgi:hypothetical protein
MARDPSKKGVRKIPPEFIKWIEVNYGAEVAKWYKKTTGTGKAEATKQRQGMSNLVGQTGAYHEGHFQGAKDFDGDMGGGPTTGRTMRPQIGVYNVSHAELPRISKRDMKRLGIPQYWVEDFYEAILESEGNKVIGNLDVQGAFEMDRGASAEQAAYNSRTRDDLRKQGVEIPGDRYTGVDRPAPITQLPDTQPLAPKFDASSIKEGTGIPRIVGESRTQIPDLIETTAGSVKLNRKAMAGLAAGGLFALGPLGTAASAAEVKGRTDIAKETGNIIDQAQVGIASVSLAGDLASYSPFTAIPGALISTGADSLNVAIDSGRAYLSGEATYNRRKLERQEQLRSKPADAPERGNKLSVGFAEGGM